MANAEKSMTFVAGHIKIIALAVLLTAVGDAAFSQEASYVSLGQYYSNTAGPTSTYVRLPGNDGEYRDWLSWGYDIWGRGKTEPPPGMGWVVSESLFDPPYNVPENATAVRIHIKTKVTGVTWAEQQVAGTIQVTARPWGSDLALNELIHSTAQKAAGHATETPIDLNHIETDVLLGGDGRIEIFRFVTIAGHYAQVDLIVYLAGYWAPEP